MTIDTSAAPLVVPGDATPLANKNIRYSYADGATYSLMVGFGETYLAAFALAAGAAEVWAGLLTSIPLLVGGAVQLAAPAWAARLGSYRRWVLWCAGLQGLSYIPLAWAAALGHAPTILLFAIAALYWAAGMAAGPAWNNWIDALVPRTRLPHFLAVRSRITQGAAFLAFLVGGLWLNHKDAAGEAMHAFFVMFCFAGLARGLSVYYLAKQSETPVTADQAAPLPFRQVLRRFREPAASRFLLFMLASQVSVNLAAPFFSPYMLAHVHFNYLEYVVLVSAAFAAKIILYPWISRVVRRLGAYHAMRYAGAIVAPLPLFWFWTPALPALVVVQIVGGAAWGTFELAAALLVFDRIPAKERMRILTWYNAFNAIAVVLGSVIGGLVLESFAKGQAYRYVFTASAIARALSLGVLIGVGNIPARFRELSFRILALRPGHGGVGPPVVDGEGADESGASRRRWPKRRKKNRGDGASDLHPNSRR